MIPLLIVKVEIVSQLTQSCVHRAIVVKIKVLILNTLPEPLNEDVVKYSASAVPTNGNVSRFKSTSKRTEVNWLSWSVLNIKGLN